MENIKVCPHCGSKQFMAHIIRGCLVESDGVNENNEPIFKIIKEGSKTRYELEIVCCSDCKHNVTAKDLVTGIKCNNCGNITDASELDENGNCEVCAMLLANPNLQEASQDELLRLLAHAMRGIKPDTNLVMKKQEQVVKAEIPVVDNSNNIQDVQENNMSAADAILNGNVPSDVLLAKPKKKRTVKRATDSQLESTMTEANIDTTTELEESSNIVPKTEESAINDISISQDAPFPDVPTIPEIPQQQEQSTESSSEFLNTQVGSGFQMFDSGDDEEPF